MKVETLKARQHNLHLVTEWLVKIKLGFGLDTSQMTQLGCAIIDYVKDTFPRKEKNIDTENKNACPR